MTKPVKMALVLTVCLSAAAEVSTARQAARGSADGEAAFLNRCSTCHGTERALSAPRTKRGWENVLDEMANNGAQLESGERDAILAFLTERHGLVNVNAANAEDLAGLGLSAKDAAAIVAYRNEHGPFADFAALRAVPGIDVDRLDAARARVAFRD